MGTYTQQQILDLAANDASYVEDCKIAIRGNGVSVPNNAKLADLPGYVDLIQDSKPDIMLPYIVSNNSASYVCDYDTLNVQLACKATIEPFCTYGWTSGYTELFLVSNFATKNNSNNAKYGIGISADSLTVYRSHFRSNNAVETISETINPYDASGSRYTVGEPCTYCLKIYYSTTIQGAPAVWMNIWANKQGTTGTSNITKSTYGKAFANSGTLPKCQINIFGRSGYYNNTSNLANRCPPLGTKVENVTISKSADGDVLRKFQPCLHWNASEGKYGVCFKDSSTGIYSSFNVGSGSDAYHVQVEDGDVPLLYIANGPDNTYNTAKQDVWFNTGYNPDASTMVGITCAYHFDSNGIKNGYRPFGSRALASVSDGIVMEFGSGESTKSGINIRYGTSTFSGSGRTATDNVPLTTYVYNCTTWDLHAKMGFLGESTYRYSKTANFTATNAPLCLFTAIANDAGSLSYGGVKIYDFKIFQNGRMVRYYVPVLHNNQPCFYDLINNTYIYNQGTGTPVYQTLSY